MMRGTMRCTLIACAVSAILAGCGGAQSAIGPQGPVESPTNAHSPSPQATLLAMPRSIPKRTGWVSRAARTAPVIYAANGSQVLIYPEKGFLQNPIGMITGIGYAYGLSVDKNGNLYVADATNNTVLVYPPGSTSPSQTYSQDLSRPLYPIVDGSGNLWVSNANNGTVVEYLNGSTSANQVIQTPGTEADGMDFDQQGNLYIAYRNSSGSPSSSIEEFTPGSTHGQTLGMTLNQPQGLIVDSNRNILVVETGGTNRIDLFPPGAELPSVDVPVLSDTPTELAIKQNEGTLFVSALSGTIYGKRYPFGAAQRPPYIKDEAHSQIQGIALSNGQRF